ncbi:Hypothetical protein BC94_0050 [Mycoplasmopsis bovis]|uniref:Uncharacterized protein n=1 Tax=Mycoplasmopsis bovis TaxID=28903 RepID=A0A8D4A1U3_MYCBV|nr:Hypothetical protein BC85_0050 [Mycoplasmopsis bovis]AMW25402.1 Hypothetical protein BC94_0050 [Mycoplasmopsis bovis]AMW26033.1 Hypothetical protein BC93_0050 [Mycoplasmopsis bovis]
MPKNHMHNTSSTISLLFKLSTILPNVIVWLLPTLPVKTFCTTLTLSGPLTLIIEIAWFIFPPDEIAVIVSFIIYQFYNNIKLVNCIKMNKNGKNMLFVSIFYNFLFIKILIVY